MIVKIHLIEMTKDSYKAAFKDNLVAIMEIPIGKKYCR